MDAAKPNPLAGARVVQTKVVLNGVYGANAVVETAVNAKTDWVNPDNAKGKVDGVFATFTGNATVARGGRIDLSYADFTAKSHLIITSVLLRFYAKMTSAPALGLAVPISFQWAKGGAPVTVATRTADFNATATPIEVDISADITSWADLNAVQTFVSAQTAILEIPNISLDAVHLVVNAEHTEAS